MGEWVRKVPPDYLDLDQKIAAMDKFGIDVTLLTSNDPGSARTGRPSRNC